MSVYPPQLSRVGELSEMFFLIPASLHYCVYVCVCLHLCVHVCALQKEKRERLLIEAGVFFVCLTFKRKTHLNYMVCCMGEDYNQ